jgi:hypothetical protein
MPVLLIAVLVLGGLYLLSSGAVAAQGNGGAGSAPVPPDNTPAPTWVLGPHMTITNDPVTWPAGDGVWSIAQAIAIAEGANIAGSNPDRLNNPGDISDGFKTFGGEAHSGSNVTHFPDKETGWQWLYNKIQNIWDGNSSVYSPDMTWTQIAQKWAGNWQAWVANVTNQLGVSPDSTLNQYLG